MCEHERVSVSMSVRVREKDVMCVKNRRRETLCVCVSCQCMSMWPEKVIQILTAKKSLPSTCTKIWFSHNCSRDFWSNDTLATKGTIRFCNLSSALSRLRVEWSTLVIEFGLVKV